MLHFGNSVSAFLRQGVFTFQSLVQSCCIDIVMTCLLDGLLQSLNVSTSRAIAVLDWQGTLTESPEWDVFVITNKSLQTKSWIKIQASLTKLPSSSDKVVLLITSSAVFLNALRHKLTDLGLFSILVIGDSASLLSTQSCKLLSENDTYNIFVEFIRRESRSESLSPRHKVISVLTPSLIYKASRIARKSTLAGGASPILAELASFYSIERWWSPSNSSPIRIDASVIPAHLPTFSSLKSVLKHSYALEKKPQKLINTLMSLELHISPKVALALLSQLDEELESEHQSISSLTAVDEASPSVMQKVWLQDLEQYRLLFTAARQHLLSGPSSKNCSVEALLRALALNEAHWRNSKAVVVLQEPSHVSTVAHVIRDLVGSRWRASIESTASNQPLRSQHSDPSLNDTRIDTLFGTDLLSSVDEFGQIIFDKDESLGFKRCIQVISWRGSSSKALSSDTPFDAASFVIVVGLPRQEHEVSALADLFSCSTSLRPSLSGLGPTLEPSTQQTVASQPAKTIFLIPSHRLKLATKRLDMALSTQRSEEVHTIIARLINGDAPSSTPSHEVLQRFTRRPTSVDPCANSNGVEERSRFSIPAQLSSRGPPSSFNGIPLHCSHLSAHIIVHRWLHRLHSGSMGGSSLPSSPSSLPSSPSSKDPISRSDVTPLPNAIMWCQDSLRPAESPETNVFALFPSHSPLHGIPFRSLITTHARCDKSASVPSPLEEEGTHYRPTWRDRRIAFLQKCLPRLQRQSCQSAALAMLYAMNMLDDHLRPTWTLPTSTLINRESCVSHHRYSIVSSFLEGLTALPSPHDATSTRNGDSSSHEPNAPSPPALTAIINKKALDELVSRCLSLKPSSMEPGRETIRPNRGLGAPRPAIPALSELLIEGESIEMDESSITSIEALNISIKVSTNPQLDAQSLSQADPNLIAFIKAMSSGNLNPNVQPLGETRLALLTKGALFPAHRLPHAFPLADKDHRLLVCTLEKSESIRLSVAQVRKLRFFHHRLFSLVNFSGSAEMEASWNHSVYQYIIAPLTLQPSFEIDWKSVDQTINGIPRHHSTKASAAPDSYEKQWKEWVGSFVQYDAHPEQRYFVKDVDFLQSPLSPSMLDSSTTIADAMFLKHSFTISDLNQPLLSVKMLSTKPFNGLLVTAALTSAQQLNIGAMKDTSPQAQSSQPINPYKFLHLVPEMVTLHSKSFPADIISILGSVIYRIETYARIEEVLKDIEVPNLGWKELLTSFSPTVSNEETNFEVLETYGDCILKLFVASFLSRPGGWSLNNRFGGDIWSHRWISNAHLCTLAMSRNLDLHLNLGYAFAAQMISAVKHSEKRSLEKSETWSKSDRNSGNSLSKSNLVVLADQRHLQPYSCYISGFGHGDGAKYPSESANIGLLKEKTIADFAESFLGVVFQAAHINGANALFNYLGIPELCLGKTVIASLPIEKTKDELLLEKSLDFSFSNASLLREALTHESYFDATHEKTSTEENHATPRPKSFHSLCHLGDALFDYLIFIYIHRRFPHATPGEHTHLKSIGVCGCAQAVIASSLNLNRLLRHSSKELSTHLQQFEHVLSTPPFAANNAAQMVPFWRYTGLDFPEPLAMALEALVGATFEDIGRDLDRLERIWLPLLEPFWNKHVAVATRKEPQSVLRDQSSSASPDRECQSLAHAKQQHIAIESFWPKALLSSLVQHLKGRKCKAYSELPPMRLPFSRAFIVKSSYHGHTSIGIASSKRCAQSDSASRMIVSLLQQHALSSPCDDAKSTQSLLFERMEAICDCKA